MDRRVVVMVVVAILAMTVACGGNKGTDQRSAYDELVVGTWAVAYSLDNGQVEHYPNDELYWVFVSDGRYRSVENEHDGTFDIDCQSCTYAITEDSLSLINPSDTTGDFSTFGYAFSTNGDTLRLVRNTDETVAKMSRADDAPDWRDWEM